MKSSPGFSLIFAAVSFLQVAAAHAAKIDMDDPSRALGREDDVRIDAQLNQDTVSAGAPVGVTYQVENLSNAPIALAEKVCDVSFDPDTLTIVVSIGSEVPKDGLMPHLSTIPPGQKKVFSAGGLLHVQVAGAGRSLFARTPRAVQIKVNILRDLAPFQPLMQRQAQTAAAIALDDDQFEKWIESNDTIFLNTIPVRYNPAGSRNPASAESGGQPALGGSF